MLLSKLSASSDVAVGFPIAGRSDTALDDLIGFFVNTLVLRVDLGGNPSVAELLDQVRTSSLAAYEHQDVPFEVLVERLNPARSLTHHPLIQVMLGWQNLPAACDTAAGLVLGDLEITPLPVDTKTARMDLAFSLAERWTTTGAPAGIGGIVEFRTDVLRRGDRARAHRPAAACADHHDGRPRPDPGGAGACSTTPNARGWMRWATPTHSTRSDRPRSRYRAVRYPLSPARRTPWRSAARPDRDLRGAGRGVQPAGAPADRHGAGPGQTVLLVLSRSAEAITAMLAILKTGAAYLPIDPAWPAERIDFVLADAAPVAAVANPEFVGLLAGFDGTVIDPFDLTLHRHRTGSAVAGPAADNLAYVIYTSGTTGVPKGVGLTHANVTSCSARWNRTPPAAGVWSHAHSLAFDVSVWEIFGPLLRGGRVVVVPEAVPSDVHDLHIAAGGRGRHRTHPNTLGGSGSARPKGLESDGAGRGRRSLLTGGGADSWTPGADHAQRLRTHRDHHVRQRSVPAGRRGRGTVPIGSPVRACRRCSCWTPGCGRSRSGSPVSCTWPGPDWVRATWVAAR